MQLKTFEKKNILKNFPNIELSYEKNLHKKVHADIYLTIPKGKKYFAWFTRYKNNNYCFILEINRRYNSITDISINVCSFDYKLCIGIGTILYGTIFYVNKKKFFNIEDIFYIKGHSLNNTNLYTKINRICDLMKYNIKQQMYTKNSIIFGCPNITTNYNSIINIVNELPYDLYCIQLRTLYKNTPYLNKKITIQKTIYKIFKIKAEITNDIYCLYYINNGTEEKFEIANIPDYNTSVFMNKIFRQIKENDNLDALEESDDEEEFENISLDKFVDLNKEVNMKCEYIKKFRSWKPVSVSSEKICDKREINIYKKK